MTTLARASAGLSVLPHLAAIILGVGILAVAGHAQSPLLHDAAHDVRHATGFPCH